MGVEGLPAAEMLLAAFAGGAFGAAVGALPSFSLAGLVVVVGELYAIAARTIGDGTAVDVTGQIGFGVVLGPHVAFAGGAGAVAYAARQGYLDTDFEYHEAKHVTRGLGSKPDVLAVGGAFGVVGYLVATVAGAYRVPVDPVALGVVGSALAHRIVLGYTVVGAPAGSWLDMSPGLVGQGGEPGEATTTDEGDPVSTDGGTTASTAGARPVEPWLPSQCRWHHVATLGAVVGILSAYTAYVTGSAFLAFGLTVAVLFLLCAGVADIPVTHHMALPASTVVLALAGVSGGGATPATIASAVSMEVALLAGAAFGVFGGLLGELCQRVCYAHAETHLDPPAASIVVTSASIAGLAMAGVVPTAAWVPA